MSTITVGKKFDTLKDVYDFVSEVENNELITFYKRDAKKLTTVSKIYPQKCKKAKNDLIYYRLEYTCIKGGKRFKSVSKGARKVSTFREDCPMKIVFTLAEDGQSLILSNAFTTHNHNVNKETFSLFPRKRHLDNEEKEEVLKLKRLKCNKTLLKDYMQHKTGKNVLLRDLTNIRATTSSNSDLLEVARILQEDEDRDSVTELLIGEDNILQGIYFQESAMKNSFSLYPELLLLDATYKLNNLRMPFYILMSIDGNNAGIVVCTFLLQNEDSESIGYMLKIFKEHNPSWNKTKTILTDKDFSERKTLSTEFPNANLLLCLFHTLKAFRTTITTQSMGINGEERQVVLSLLQKMAYSKTKDIYEINYRSLVELNFLRVLNYLNNNWHNCKEEWVQCFKKKCCTYGVATTNHLESFNQKIKAVCTKYSTLQDFYREFRILSNSVNSERKQTCLHMMSKKFSSLTKDSLKEKYFKIVTPFAFKFIENNLSQSETVTFDEEQEDYCILKRTAIKVSQNYCECNYFMDMQLPCKHMFKFRQLKGLDLYSEDLIPKRFRKHLYFRNYGLHLEGTSMSNNVTLDESNVHYDSDSEYIKIQSKCERSILTQQQKYTRVLAKCQQIATIVSEMSMSEFNKHYSQLETLVNMWNEHKQTIIVEETVIDEETEMAPENTLINIEPDIRVEETSITEQPNITVEKTLITEELNITVEKTSITGEPGITVERTSITEEPNTTVEKTTITEEPNITVEKTSVIEKPNITFKSAIVNEETDITAERTSLMENPNTRSTVGKIGINKDSEELLLLENIKMPLKMKRRGRPKGIDVTVVGLRKKKKCNPFLK